VIGSVIRREVREFEHGEFSQPSKTKLILLMVQKSGDHHLGCIKPVGRNGISTTNLNPVNNGVFAISAGAGFLPSTVSC